MEEADNEVKAGEEHAATEQTTVQRKESKRVSVRTSSPTEELPPTAETHETGEPPRESTIHENQKAEGDPIQHEHAEGEHGTGEHLETKSPKSEQVEGEQVAGEHVKGEHVAGEDVAGEHVAGEHVVGEGEEGKKEEVGGEHLEVEQLEGEMGEEHLQEGMMGEHMEGEFGQEEHVGEEGQLEEQKAEEVAKPADEEMVEEEGYVEEPPPDPAAPYNFTDSKEALKEPFELRPDQMAEVEQLWETYQNYTPAYTDINGYITVKELCYLLRCLLIYPFTEEQLYELIDFAVRPPHPDGHITFDQFVRIVKLRLRDFPQEEELRLALQVFDPEKSGILDRDNLKDCLINKGNKASEKVVMSLVKEVDLTNDGTLGVEDIVGTMAIDMNRDDIILMQSTLNTYQEQLSEILGVAVQKNDDDEEEI